MEKNFESRINSINLEMISILPGTFTMGTSPNDPKALWDEFPSHLVEISAPFEISATEITNFQYELFDSSHKKLRGNKKGTGFSAMDNEAVVNVSWYDAMKFCEWLSEKEGKEYRLPTEAEWEYCCRANTTTPYYTGKELSPDIQKDQRLVKKWDAKKFYKKYDLVVGKTQPNPWGLFDMHGNVENWCLDKFGNYTEENEIDPLYEGDSIPDGNARVTRGGSFGVKIEHLRSSRRLGMMPDDKNWIVGFRVVCASSLKGKNRKNSRIPQPSSCMKNINQNDYYSIKETNKDSSDNNVEDKKPIYMNPITFLVPPLEEDRIILKDHNHCPAITYCSNGDILVVWFSTIGEHDRDMVILGSRLKPGAKEFPPASLFFRIPGRNTTGTSLLTTPEGKIYHINGIEVATSWKTLAMIIRTSDDNGETWTEPRFLCSKHQFRNQVIPCAFQTREGDFIQLCDATPAGRGGTAFWISKDEGETYKDLGLDEKGKVKKKPRFRNNSKGAWIAGIHGSAVELNNSTFMAFGRGDYINSKTPKSISQDGGYTWKYSASPFPQISYGQRFVFRRLNEGPLLFVSFTSPVRTPNYKLIKGMMMRTLNGDIKNCYGLFAAISYDEGETWPVKRFLDSRGNQGNRLEKRFGTKMKQIIDETHGDLKGYLAATQSPDGIIHLISSTHLFRFNLAWLEEK